MNAIEIKGLCKSFKDFSIDNLDLTVPRGCVVGLVGENGAGKSTTIKLILNLLRKDSGTVSVLGRDSADGLEQVKEDIGVVFDECCFPSDLNAMAMGRIFRAAYKNWDSQVYSDFLGKFDLPEKKKIGKFSRGMKMKLSIAAAMSHHAKLLVLDEATSGLDPVVRDDIIDIIGEFASDEEHSVLISSHIVSDLEKVCDYIAFMHKGRLMLFEEKDRMYEHYVVIHCTEKELADIRPEAVIGKKVGAFGVEAIILKDAVPKGIQPYPVDIEKLFVFMVKENT